MTNTAVEMQVAKETNSQTSPIDFCAELLLEPVESETVDMEAAADALLASAGALGKEHGIYTDRQLSRKMRDENARIPALDESAVSQEVSEYVLESKLEDLIDLANLSPLQEICLRLHVAGLSLREIAKSIDVNVQSMAAHLRVARRKIRPVCKEGKYAGWYEVYLSEIRRTGSRGRK